MAKGKVGNVIRIYPDSIVISRFFNSFGDGSGSLAEAREREIDDSSFNSIVSAETQIHRNRRNKI